MENKTSTIYKKLQLLLKESGPIFPLVFFVGGLWQFFELANMSFAYVRFFSVSQTLADGMLILGTLSVFFLASVPYYFYFKENLKKLPFLLFLLLLGSLIIFFIDSFFLHSTLTKTIQPYTFGLSVAVAYLGIAAALLTAVLVNKNLIKKIDKNTDNLTIYIISGIFVVCVVLQTYFFHKSSIPDTLTNLKNTKCYSISSGYRFNKIKYYNDKYIFIEVVNLENSQKGYQIFKFDSLFNNC